jgi:hypothetical protein
MTVLSIITPMKPWNANRYVYNINDNTTMANTEQAKIEPLTEIVASLPPEFPMNAVKLRKHLNENGHSKTRISTLVSAGLLVKTKESHIFKYELPINEITKNGVDLELSVTDFNTIKREAHAYRIRTTSYIRKVLAGEINPLANVTFKSNAANIAACA